MNRIDENGTTLQNDLFHTFYEEVAAADDPGMRNTLVDSFLSSLHENNYPILENDTTAVLLYRNGNGRVSMISDLTDMADATPMEKIKGTDLYYIRLHAREDARIEYFFVSDEQQIPFPDPLNSYRVYYGVWTASELAMPGYKRHPVFDPFLNGPKGSYDRVVGHTIEGNIMGYPHLIHVYHPPGYGESSERYPAVYFQDGSDYIESAYVPYILDALIGDNTIEPVIGVFVTPPNRYQPEMPNRMTEYGMNDDYVSFFTEELVTYIDSEYRTKADPYNRLVVGDSYGGLISLYIALKRPDIFGAAYSQSGYVSFNDDRIIQLFESRPVQPVRLYVDIGIYERNVGSQFLPSEETDFLEGNRRFRKVLEEKGYEFIYREHPEGHTWGNWRRHLVDVLINNFGN